MNQIEAIERPAKDRPGPVGRTALWVKMTVASDKLDAERWPIAHEVIQALSPVAEVEPFGYLTAGSTHRQQRSSRS